MEHCHLSVSLSCCPLPVSASLQFPFSLPPFSSPCLSQSVTAALLSLRMVYPRRNLPAEQWRSAQLLSLLSAPAAMLDPACCDTVSVMNPVACGLFILETLVQPKKEPPGYNLFWKDTIYFKEKRVLIESILRTQPGLLSFIINVDFCISFYHI